MDQVQQAIQNARQALQQGDRSAARRWAERAAAMAPGLEEPWLLLAAVSNPEASLAHLKRALKINPQSVRARKGLAWAEQRLKTSAPDVPVQAAPSPKPGLQPSVATTPPPAPLPVIKPVLQLAAQPAVRPAAPSTLQSGASSGTPPQKTPRQIRYKLRHANWPLYIGALTVLLLLVVAIKGPDWAPMDPMEEHYILRVDGKVRTPPYPAFTVPGYPLGTDRFGRDLLSRLLWAVRPTMIMVFVVAGVRLGLGVVLGLTAGWARGRLGRGLDWLIAAALSLPVLFVALGGIAAVGTERGLIAFIVGLALTGWAETARLVSEQTRTIKQQVYVEAANALGASGTRILFGHVLPQIMPLLWMLLAFEIGGTLLVAAELGFLGYYIGGGVWIEISDFVSVNVEGLPELGQMLSIALLKLTEPTALMVVGSAFFFSILGFNLLGIGIKTQQSLENAYRKRRMVMGNAMAWVEEKITQPASYWLEEHARPMVATMLLVTLVAGGLYLWNRRPVRQEIAAVQLLEVPGEHLWASDRHDAQGTLWANVTGPKNPKLLWSRRVEQGFSGGPAIAADGTIYLTSYDGRLTALSPNGAVLWEIFLPEQPVGSPALGAAGQIYVAGRSGTLSAFTPDGELTWSTLLGRSATSGPVVAADGTLYLTLIDIVQAVSAQGEKLWDTYATDSYLEMSPRLSAAGVFVFLKDAVMAADSGALLNYAIVPGEGVMFTDPAYFVGAERGLYYRAGYSVYPWSSTEAGLQVGKAVETSLKDRLAFFPADAGVTPEKLVWMLYSNDYADTRLLWLDFNSILMTEYRSPNFSGVVIGVDRNSVAYLCSPTFQVTIDCAAIQPGANEPVWMVSLPNGLTINGGALTEGRLYVTTKEGYFYVLGE